ncbi:YihY/virulence factor BrkB family protein [Halorarum halophilum]|uniref:YihY/virulence factor BrkB family protein n=1 Tax=Halorarum halophilum TaxID=2743090 RepID=A0A7D5K9R0_9EURY|nr:YihY/virulence factor BrkB family protein [Halobaculum halophilum]QLG29259.1 YihY/virulence factor BrkB family protein [Halobaculum halophilum]
MVSLSGVVGTGKRIFSEFSGKNVTFMAAGIAYNAFISLAPLLLVLLLTVTAFGGGLEGRIVELARGALPGPIADVIAEVFEGNDVAAGASAVGLLTLLWGTLKIFRGLDTAFSEIYETEGQNSLPDQLVDGLVVLVAILVAVTATVGVTVVFARLSDTIPFVGVLTPLVLVAGLVVAFLPIYYRFPDTDVSWGDVLPGVVFAAVGWAVLQALFQVYIASTGGGTGSFFGGVIVVITWLYFSGLVLLLGAVINAVLGGHASGKAGGVGQGAAGFDTTHEEGMSRDEFAQYLRGLREGLTGHYEGMRPMEDAGGDGRYPRPVGDVEVIEQTSREGDHDEWAVSFRWRAEPDESDDRTDTGGS